MAGRIPQAPAASQAPDAEGDRASGGGPAFASVHAPPLLRLTHIVGLTEPGLPNARRPIGHIEVTSSALAAGAGGTSLARY